MRGRTLNDAFIILDEAQNTSPEQMKMFLTRLGFGSKMVVTGDITQVDLPGGTKSGLRVVEDILTGIEDVAFNRLTAPGRGAAPAGGPHRGRLRRVRSADGDLAEGGHSRVSAARSAATGRERRHEHRGPQRVRRRRRRQRRSRGWPAS